MLHSRLKFEWLPAEAAAVSTSDACVLGAVQFGGAQATGAIAQLPHAVLNKPALAMPKRADAAVVIEVWSGPAAAQTIEVPTTTAGTVRCRHNGDILFGAVTVPVARQGDDALGEAAYAAYRAMLECLRDTGYASLLRVWNSIPDINVDDAGLERYRRFNVQRFRALQECALPTHAGAPAATALGTFGGPLVLHFIAGRAAAQTVENPRQVSAYHYPAQYGPRAPNFSRGALWTAVAPGDDVLFISGTASIVGHETQHAGDVVAQTRETLVNLETVLAQARARAGAGSAVAALSLPQLSLKAYLRHRADLPAVRATLADAGIAPERVLFLHADICRADLLVEIEAIGGAGSA